MAIAAAVRKRGIGSVMLVERSAVGSGSSAELTGGFRDLFAAPALLTLSQRSIDLFDEFKAGAGDLGWRQCGYLYLATEEAQFARLPYAETNRGSYRGRLERLSPEEIR